MKVQVLKFMGLCAAAMACCSTVSVHAAPGELTVVSIAPVQPALAAALSRFERETGLTVVVQTASRSQLKSKVHGGDHPDVVIAPEISMNELAVGGDIQPETRSAVGRAGVGLAVAVGAAVPDVSSVESARQALMKARSLAIADPQNDPGGTQAQAVLVHLGIADAMKAKTRLGSGSNPLASVGFGEVEMGLHPVNEILATRGLKLAASMPAAVQQWTRYDMALIENAPNESEAQRLLGFLKGPAAQADFQAHGIEPAP